MIVEHPARGRVFQNSTAMQQNGTTETKMRLALTMNCVGAQRAMYLLVPRWQEALRGKQQRQRVETSRSQQPRIRNTRRC